LSKANLKLLGLGMLWIGGGMALMILSGQVGGWLLLVIPLLMITVGVLTYRVRCHVCRWPLIKRWWGVAPYAPRACPKCGETVA
jgi:hypothetical protein